MDFELAYSPEFPYSKDDYNRHVPNLYARETIQTNQIINNIAGILNENINFVEIENIFNKYGFYL